MKRLALAVALLTAVTAYAQLRSPFQRGPIARTGVVLESPGTAGMISAIKGAPFSADTVIETSRTLADGNHIHETMRGSVCRDSEGRTRSDSPALINGTEDERHVLIVDPVLQVVIHFNTFGERVATVTPMHGPSSTASALSSSPGRPGIGTGPGTAPGQQTQPARPVREDLGTQEIEGITVQGTRITRTIAAGAEGNEEPIVSVTERWISRELHETLLTESDDPRSGHRTTKLVNVQRSEPDAALFQVPPDYTVKEQ
jgi:hypothetical protein